MQLGNRKDLDAARNALRDQFDAIWMRADALGEKKTRALRCALKLDRPNYDSSPNWIVFPGGRASGAPWDVIRG